MQSVQSGHRRSIRSISGCILILFLLGMGCSESTTEPESQTPQADYDAPRLSTAPVIDGRDTDTVWQDVPWASMSEWILGDTVTNPGDYQGRYKIGWTESKLYVLIDIVDDDFSSCYDDIRFVGEDDCAVLFIDEDHSGGSYQSSHQAFAYFIELDSSVVSFTTNPDANFAYFNDHIDVAQFRNRDKNTWELAVDVFTSAYTESMPAQANVKAVLEAGKEMGLTVAYFDADFCRSSCAYASAPQLKNTNTMIWENADHFGTVVLTD